MKAQNIKKIVAVVLLLVVIFFGGLYAFRSYGVGLPFGGFIVSTFFCSCDGGWLITVGPPLGGEFVYRNTPQYPYSQLPRPGVWVLGLYEPGATCSFIAGKGCAARPASGIITPIVGTSL